MRLDRESNKYWGALRQTIPRVRREPGSFKFHSARVNKP